MNFLELSLFAAILISTDIMIPLSVTPYKKFPTLYTIILGAGLWNDMIVVVLTEAFNEQICPIEK